LRLYSERVRVALSETWGDVLPMVADRARELVAKGRNVLSEMNHRVIRLAPPQARTASRSVRNKLHMRANTPARLTAET
jgi:hypothetical protein